MTTFRPLIGVVAVAALTGCGSHSVARGPTRTLGEIHGCLQKVAEVQPELSPLDPAMGGASHRAPLSTVVLIPIENAYLAFYASPAQAQRALHVMPEVPGDPTTRIGNVIIWFHYSSRDDVVKGIEQCLRAATQ